MLISATAQLRLHLESNVLEMDERLPKNTTATGPAGHALCAEDETRQDGEADRDEG